MPSRTPSADRSFLDPASDVPTNEELLALSESGNRLRLPFTGERVVPGAVEPQLWNEHVSRYRFASLFAPGKHVADVGCGTGYGTELLARSALSAVGFDTSTDAILYARASFSQATYLYGSATDFPLKARSVDLVTAFEVIEHLNDWESLLLESERVLTSEGIFLVSTPNIEYYVEARGPAGPNPFHVHEFEFAEFEAVLKRVFPCVQILAQNQQETVTFSGDRRGPSMAAFIPPTNNLADAHFFLAVCSFQPLEIPFFADVSSTRNLLRDRERHIRGLQGELKVGQQKFLALSRLHERASADFQIQHDLAESLRVELQALRDEQQQIRNSAWIRLGRALGIGPWSDYRARIKIQLQRASNHAKRLKRPLQAFSDALRRQASIGLDYTRDALSYLRNVLFYLAVPLMLAAVAMTLALVDLCFVITGRRRVPKNRIPDHRAASVVIPNWNGVDLLRANLPALMRAVAAVPDVEIIVVDNGSTDGSAAFVHQNYPGIRVLALPVNQGFASACNLAAQAARHDVVVFLNNDMRPEESFLAELLERFTDPEVFAVSSQIFFADQTRLREETGLTEVWWQQGQLGVGHRVDPLIKNAYPCAYPGGGSSAFDRAKFLELGGFDHLFHPFYYEDTDLGFGAWKRGWKVLYEPASVVHHEHRGTIGKTFSSTYIDSVVRTNAMLYCWKNIHDWRLLASHFQSCLLSALATAPGNAAVRPCGAMDIKQGFGKLRRVAASRWRARELQQFSDRETLNRPLGGYYRDRFLSKHAQPEERLNVLLVSPYPIEPPTHGGAVFMREAIHALASVANVHLVSFVDVKEQLNAQQVLLSRCRSAKFLVRPHVPLTNQWTFLPNAIREFGIRDFAWAIHRTMLLEKIDILQLEYTTMGQYAGEYRNIPCMLFEHDISAQSLWRRIKSGDHDGDTVLEYLRMRLYEPRMLKRVTRVQVCSRENARFIGHLVPKLNGRIDSNVRASIDVRSYDYPGEARQPDSLLFIGSFRHSPNVDALKWFIRHVMPLVLKERPNAILHVVGSDAPTGSPEWSSHPGVRLLGAVPDVKVPLQRYSVFVCPVLSGSGVRVKLLEAFASGIPAVATSIGAEGLHSDVGAICEVADTVPDFARATLRLLSDENYRKLLAKNARHFVVKERDSRQATARLEALYRQEVSRMRGLLNHPSPELQTGVARRIA